MVRAFAGLLAVPLLLLAAQTAAAQTVWVSPPSYCAAPVVSYYTPAVSYYSPAPAVSYYAPPAVSYYSAPAASYYSAPAVSYYAAPAVSYYSAPAVSYYSAPAVSYYYTPAPVATTYYRYGVFGRRVRATTYYYP